MSNCGTLARSVNLRSLHSSYCYPFTGVRPFLHTLLGFMPILEWLPKYKFKRDLMSDIIGGFTTGIMHVPQGIAYATLAGVDPVYGLYSSCFPAFFYMFFGTSRHVSIGSFAVVALMAGVANDKVMATRGGGTVDLSRNSTDGLFDVVTHYDVTPIQVATMLTFSIGIWQIVCALLRLQFLMTYFSDPLVSGFTTGAAVHVLLAQIDDLMGVRVPKASGIGYLFVIAELRCLIGSSQTLQKRVRDLAVRVPEVNITALIVSIVAMTFLYVGKEYLSPFLARRFKFHLPIPYELILVAVTAALSTLLQWHEKNSVEIVGKIPAGLPEPDLPTFSILKECLVHSVGIAIVIIAVHISMAKMLGKKMNYHVDDSQELYAIGLTSILGGFFPVYPVSTALGRTMVNVKSGSKTQLSTVFSCALLLAIILWLGPLLRDLPKIFTPHQHNQ
ncbi:inorganic anion transporter, SulP family [Ancylostoma duodenale]|uniref:Inorganic anion transporter, SulP family n=1 Tax=Ancylostoma duodenale TaxID=51022 RepID=A0A0C2FFT7_9BILA|nr:inorganic anion transporter, SulP family [Ancylostoma duodenale]